MTQCDIETKRARAWVVITEILARDISISSSAGQFKTLSSTSHREVCKGSSTEKGLIIRARTPGRPLPSSSQIFPQVVKGASCSVNYEDMLTG